LSVCVHPVGSLQCRQQARSSVACCVETAVRPSCLWACISVLCSVFRVASSTPRFTFCAVGCSMGVGCLLPRCFVQVGLQKTFFFFVPSRRDFVPRGFCWYLSKEGGGKRGQGHCTRNPSGYRTRKCTSKQIPWRAASLFHSTMTSGNESGMLGGGGVSCGTIGVEARVGVRLAGFSCLRLEAWSTSPRFSGLLRLC
jgi:hypothetical protein